MNWLAIILEELQMTRYRLSQETGISQRYLGKIIQENIPIERVKYGQVIQVLAVQARHRQSLIKKQGREVLCIQVELPIDND